MMGGDLKGYAEMNPFLKVLLVMVFAQQQMKLEH